MIIKCKICGGDLEIQQSSEIAICEYCGTKQTLPKLSDEKRLHLYERANHFRRNNEYDKAMGIYEMILNEDGTDAEAYWSLVLCKYGVEYVEDPVTKRRIPTCNRTLNTSVMADADYKEAIRNASSMTREIYEEEAKKIDEIQREILAISAREDAYDIFICYKESDERGRRTRDSVLAYDIYQQLTKEGYRVFFARVSLEDKIGTAYEPYIYSALNSSRIMIVVGTEKDYFNAVWVKNEWSRFLNMMRENPEKVLIPAYRDMDPYDLPDELSYLQAQDMNKLGFMQDLLHGISKIMEKNKKVNRHVVSSESMPKEKMGVSIENLLLRIESFLRDGDVNKAQAYCDKVLDIKIDEAKVYIAQLRIHAQRKYGGSIRSEELLYAIPENISRNSFYLHGLQYAQGEYKEKLQQIAINNEKYCYEKVIKPQIAKGKVPEHMYIDLIRQFVGEPGEDKWQLFLDYIDAMKKCEEEENLLKNMYADKQIIQKQYDTADYECEGLTRELQDLESERRVEKIIVISCMVLPVISFLLLLWACAEEADGMIAPIVISFIVFLTIAIVRKRNSNLTSLEQQVGQAWGRSNEMEQVKNQAEKNLNQRNASIDRKKKVVQQNLDRVQEVRKQIDEVLATEQSDANEIADEVGMGKNVDSNGVRYELGTVAFVCGQCGKVSTSKMKPFKCMACNADGKQIARKQYTENGWK